MLDSWNMPDIVQAVVMFLGLLSVFALAIAFVIGRQQVKDERTTKEYLQENFDAMMDEANHSFKAGVIDKDIEYIVIPTKAVYDVLSESMASFLYFVIRDYQEKYGEVNIDKDGNKFEVMVRGKDGRFI
ncbi:MAG: hypothetical protein ACXABY_09500 [Candidatus Thorarchaeota archaeon]|jgi:hypothetical protein